MKQNPVHKKQGAVAFDEARKLQLLKLMLESRLGDEREKSMIRQGKGWFQISSAGHEALAALGLFLTDDDYTAPYYRDRAFMLTRGFSTFDVALNFLAKRTSSSGGRQLPGHYSSRSKKIWTHASPVGAHLLPACGIAWGIKLDKGPGIVVASLGEAAARQGDFFEAICFAKEKQLPILFVVEDNKLGISTQNRKTNPYVMGAVNTSDWTVVDGSDVEAVFNASAKCVQKLRQGKGPAFLWLDVERIESHSIADDQRLYRSEMELSGLPKRDPLPLFKDRLISEGLITEKEYVSLEQEIKEYVRGEYAKADLEPDPTPEDTTLHLFGESPPPEAPPVELGSKSRMVEAINLTLKAAIGNNPDCLIYGQDVEDPKGGVFKLTAGLSKEFPDNVFNAPVAESTIVGLACGLAAYGKIPIFEIQFIDFITPAWNQLVSNLATTRWRSFGDWDCPVVIYAPCGAYLPGGAIWHSQTNESQFASIPGLQVVMPATPSDCASLMWTAIQSRDPVLVLIPKHLMWLEQPVGTLQAVPLGKSRTIRTGNDLTLVSWGNCLELVQKCLDERPGASVELIDLRSIMPWDSASIKASVARTGRLLVVQEDVPNCSAGQMIVSEILQDTSLWAVLKAPPTVVARENVQIGLNPIYEYAALPDVNRIGKAIDLQLATSLVSAFTQPLTAPASPAQSIASPVQQTVPVAAPTVFKIQVPILGEGIHSARIISLSKKPGDPVACDDALCELETDKAVFPVESPKNGTLVSWLIKPDDEVTVGQEIAEIRLPASAAATPAAPVIVRAAQAAELPPESSLVTAPRKLLSNLITRVFHSEGEREKKSGLSSEVIQQMQGIVPATITLKAKWEAIREGRKHAQNRWGSKAPSPSALIAWLTLQAMKKHEMFTYTVTMDRVQKDTGSFDLGVAVSLPDDQLATAVVKEASRLSWEEFTTDFVAAIHRVRRGQHDSKTRCPLVISTMGPFDVRSAVPVVVPPAMATLFVGSAHFEPVKSAELKVQEVVNLTLTFDHRWINGVGSASFMADVRKNIETFKLPD
mgnify:FL=1